MTILRARQAFVSPCLPNRSRTRTTIAIAVQFPLRLAAAGAPRSILRHATIPRAIATESTHPFPVFFMHAQALTYAANTFSLEHQDLVLTGAILAVVGTWLAFWQRLTSLHVVSSTVTRKVIHISCGPCFVFLWPYFTDAPSARVVAAAVPLLSVLLIIFSGFAREGEARGALGRALSREGKARDVLQGPLYYSGVLLVVTLLLFKSTAGAVAIMQLCFGDGAAEVFGRLFGARTQWGLSWTGDKSIAGSAGFVLAAFAGSYGAVRWLHQNAISNVSVADPVSVWALAVISVACAALELVPKDVLGDDNLSISVTAVLLCVGLFGMQALH